MDILFMFLINLGIFKMLKGGNLYVVFVSCILVIVCDMFRDGFVEVRKLDREDFF